MVNGYVESSLLWNIVADPTLKFSYGRLLPYHVFAEYEEDEIYAEDQPPVKDTSSVQEWDDDRKAEAIRMAEEFEKQVVTFNVAVRKSAAGAARAEERLMVENLLLADEQRQSEHVRALVRQQQLVALQKQQQQQMMAEQRQQQHQMMAALQQRQQPATIMPAQGNPGATDLFLDAYAAGEQSAYSWMTAPHAVPQPRQQQPDA
uniref:GLTSCR protein conserved domain-containing protein n=1 Tax=Oryza meridionalis TaxID=40149 RepID=A0A0E0D137_9ORYZ